MSTRTSNAVAAARRGQNTNRIVMGVGGAIIVALVAAIAVAVITATNGTKAAGPAGQIVTPAAATANGGLRVGAGSARTTVAVYLDYMCPFCGRFERANGADLGALVAGGEVALELHPMSFLDRASNGAEYSTRAANAVVTVADRSADRLLAFSSALYENQPAEGSRGLDDARIAELAAGAGVPATVISDFADRTYVPWIEQATRMAFDSGITGTPTVKINGVATSVDIYTAGPLRSAITAQ